MKRTFRTFEDFKRDALKDPEVKRYYDALQPEFAMIDALIRARAKKGMTQEEIARRMGTKQPVISRIESGRANPSVAFLKRLAQVLGTRLEIKFV